jgi:superoxide reductase
MGTVFKCNKTNLTLEVLTGTPCQDLICCGEKLESLSEKNADSATEKHVPILQETKNGIKIVVGSTAHPMTEEHYIVWIEVINGDYVNRKYLHPGDKPEAEFYVPNQSGLKFRSYCNVHELWKG